MGTRLTDRALKALKPKAKQYDVMDDERGFGVRVGKTGIAFILLARFPRSKHPTRRTIGQYPSMTLADARDKAREWRNLIKVGKDPDEIAKQRQREVEEHRLSEARKVENTFASVAEAYFAHMRGRKPPPRGSVEVERVVRSELLPRWAQRPIGELSRRDLIEVLDAAVKRGAPSTAHHVHSYASRVFSWAVSRDKYGIEANPFLGMNLDKIVGPENPRTRVLDDDELRALWEAAGDIGYPFGPYVKMLMLTGQRKGEVSDLPWKEIKANLWTVPPERFKSKEAHLVPLTQDACAILDDLPRFKGGDYVFSTTYGEAPIRGFSNLKIRLDRKAKIAPFVLHDIRRTVRTRLASLKVSDIVAEMVIGHGKKGLGRIYDQHKYLDEMREALDLWAHRLREIVTPPPANVVKQRDHA